MAADGPGLTIVTSPLDRVRATEHLSGDALPVGTRYRIVIVPTTEGPLTVGVTGNNGLYYASRVSPGRRIQLPFNDGWYTVPANGDAIRVTANQGRAGTEHVISPLDPSAPKSAIFDGAGANAVAAKAVPLSASFASQDFRGVFNELTRFRSVAQRLANTREQPPVSGAGVTVFRKAAPSVVAVLTNEALGSGVVVAAGEVLTNWHVIENAKAIRVALKPLSGSVDTPKVFYEARLVKYDQVADLALLRYTGPYVPPLNVGDERKLEVGTVVHAIGHPEAEYWSYTQGVVSQLRPDYQWDYDDGMQHAANVIQTQTPINPGNSGGPLMDDSATVVGINSYSTDKSQGLNFAVAASDIKRFLTSSENRLAKRVEPKKAAPKAAKPAAAAAAAQAQAQPCEPKALQSFMDAPSNRAVMLVDTACTGRANFAAVADKSGNAPEFALIDALGEKKVAIKVVFNFRENTNLWIFYGRRDGVPTAYGYEHGNSGRPGRIVLVDPSAR